MGGRRWSEAEISYLRDNFRRFTYEYIGLRLKRSQISVKTMSKNIGLVKIWSDDDTDKLRELADESLTCDDISEVTGWCVGTVMAKAKEAGIKLQRKTKHSDECVQHCCRLHQQGIGRQRIAEVTGIPLGTVSSYIDGRIRNSALKG